MDQLPPAKNFDKWKSSRQNQLVRHHQLSVSQKTDEEVVKIKFEVSHHTGSVTYQELTRDD